MMSNEDIILVRMIALSVFKCWDQFSKDILWVVQLASVHADPHSLRITHFKLWRFVSLMPTDGDSSLQRHS